MRTLKAPTFQLEPAHATLLSRFLAFLYDYILIFIYIVICALMGIAMNLLFLRQINYNPLIFDLVDLLFILPVLFYFAISESSPEKASWGKRKMRLEVVLTNGERLTLLQAIIRNFFKLLPWIISHISLRAIPGWPLNITTIPIGSTIGIITVWVIVIANLISVGISKRKMSLYDFISGSMVIRLQ